MNPFRFSPIESEEKLIEAVTYVATETSRLCEQVIGHPLPITSLTIFSHSPDEFEKLTQILLSLGNLLNESNGPRVVLYTPITVNGHTITHLRIRKPDIERPQVGCNDFDIADYAVFKATYLASHPENLRCIVRPEYEMIEFFGKNFAVLAYIISDR